MDTGRLIEQLTDAIEAHGYAVTAEPIPGEEEVFRNHLRDAFTKIEETMAFGAATFGYRGRSKAALASLHRFLPAPAWGVELRIGASPSPKSEPSQ